MEWVVLDPCDQALNPAEVEQELYINHCLWWAWAAIMWMGCEVAPKEWDRTMGLTILGMCKTWGGEWGRVGWG